MCNFTLNWYYQQCPICWFGNRHGLIKHILKTELHCHLEGSIQPAPLLKVAARNNIELPFSSEESPNKYYQLKTMFHGDVVDNYLQVAKTFNL